MKQSAAVFSALGDETRLVLVTKLCNSGPLSITELTLGTSLTRQAITKHLEVMQAVGILHSHQKGREKIWDLNEKRLQVGKDYLDLVSAKWDESLDRLKALVEDSGEKK